MTTKGGIAGLFEWSRSITSQYDSVHITNMTTSWRNGLAFCAIVHHFRPDMIDFTSLDPEDVYTNNHLAFACAERLGIPALLDASDMARMTVPDRLSVITYVMQLYSYFHDKTTCLAAARATTSGLDSPALGRVERSPQTDRSAATTSDLDHHPASADEDDRSHINICHKCGRRIYLFEKIYVDGYAFHRTCFRCSICDTLLIVGFFQPSPHAAEQYVCLRHYNVPGAVKDNKDAAENAAGDYSVSSLPNSQIYSDANGSVNNNPVEIRIENLRNDDGEGNEHGHSESEQLVPEHKHSDSQQLVPSVRTPASTSVYEGTSQHQEKEILPACLADVNKSNGTEPSDSTGDTLSTEPAYVAHGAVVAESLASVSDSAQSDAGNFDVETPNTENKICVDTVDADVVLRPKPPPRRSLGKNKKPSAAAVLKPAEHMNAVGEKEYPDDLNPFGDDEENDEAQVGGISTELSESSENKQMNEDYDESLNPFADDDNPGDIQSGSNNSGLTTLGFNRQSMPPGYARNLHIEGNRTSLSPSMSGAPRRSKRQAPPPPGSKAVGATAGTATPKKKRAAPPRPLPRKRTIKMDATMTEDAIAEELEKLAVEQLALESAAQKLEIQLREQLDLVDDDELKRGDLLAKWFDFIRQRNELLRRETELVHIRRQLHLDEIHADVEYRLRCLMGKPKNKKTEAELVEEEHLLERLLEVIDEKNNLVADQEEERQRQLAEDSGADVLDQKLDDIKLCDKLRAADSLDLIDKAKKSQKKKLKLKLKRPKKKKFSKVHEDDKSDRTERERDSESKSKSNSSVVT